MNWITPPKLQTGDHVALLSPASPIQSRAWFDQGCLQLKKLGLKLSIGSAAKHHFGYLAGSDQARLKDFEQALIDPKIKAIFCTRGGFGSTRLLEKLDFSLIRRFPKILIGYSDITSLHLAYQSEHVFSYWGPMPCSSTGFSPFSQKWFKSICMAKSTKATPLWSDKIQIIQPGQARGRLTGGTLTLLAASIGTAYELDTKNRIVFIEDIGEAPYKLDRYLTQLLAAGKLSNAKAIFLGQFKNCQPQPPGQLQPTARRVLIERLKPLGLPLLANLPIGHIKNQLTLPYGQVVALDSTLKHLWIRS